MRFRGLWAILAKNGDSALLEEIAIQFVNQSEDTLQQIGLGLTVIGAIVAALVTQSKTEIARAPYFAYSALIFLLVSAAQIVWLQALPAMTGGYLWVLMLISLTASVLGGFFFCRIAMARSREAYDHGRMAFLAFIPIANFWLLLTPSKNAVSANRAPTIPILSGGFGVLTGFVLMAAAIGVTVYIEEQARAIGQRAQTEPMSQQAGIDFLIRSNGLEGTLTMLADESQTPITVDNVTTLARIEAVGTQLRRTYIVDLEGMTMTEEFRQGSRNGICAHPPFMPLLRAGATIREVYLERSGREIGTITVAKEDCGL